MKLYDLTQEYIEGTKVKLDKYEGKVLLIVNTASKCVYTPQFTELQELYEEYGPKEFKILGFPCNQFLDQDPYSNEEILSFCKANYGVTFDMFKKTRVKGDKINPLYHYLVLNSPVDKGKEISWNFEKFLISKDGEILKRYKPEITPSDIKKDIEKALKA
jgi:glutathione peroxidase